MKGLFIKDFLVLWRQNKLVLLLVAVYGLLPAISGGDSFFASFAVLLCAMLPITLMAVSYTHLDVYKRQTATSASQPPGRYRYTGQPAREPPELSRMTPSCSPTVSGERASSPSARK